MNDLGDLTSTGYKVTTCKFADDTKLSHPIQSPEDKDEMQHDINQLQIWADKWQMKFNEDKCAVMHM